ncbi:MAG: hypothetical protein JW709_10245 [Sedimentisphaerales bacterium]|nr:hypothetical protein [Sedimentisphaerales bacterium]
MSMTDWQATLLTLLQTHFPLCRRPFAALAEQLTCSEDEVLDECRRLQFESIIRRIGATFDARRLGYHSTLVGAEAATDKLEGLVAELKTLPGVSHCYERRHALNVWFTLNAVSLADIETLLAGLKHKYQLSRLVNLPAVKLYKLNAIFTNVRDAVSKETSAPQTLAVTKPMFNDEQKQLVRLLQEDMTIQSDFFAPVAEALNWPSGTVLRQIDVWRRKGVIRRFGATVRHHKLGWQANAMVVFAVKAKSIDRAGMALASLSEVSHCYQRATALDWPYNLYAMMHAADEGDLGAIIKQAVDAVGSQVCFEVLPTTAEYIKTTAKFFLEPDK